MITRVRETYVERSNAPGVRTVTGDCMPATHALAAFVASIRINSFAPKAGFTCSHPNVPDSHVASGSFEAARPQPMADAMAMAARISRELDAERNELAAEADELRYQVNALHSEADANLREARHYDTKATMAMANAAQSERLGHTEAAESNLEWALLHESNARYCRRFAADQREEAARLDLQILDIEDKLGCY